MYFMLRDHAGTRPASSLGDVYRNGRQVTFPEKILRNSHRGRDKRRTTVSFAKCRYVKPTEVNCFQDSIGQHDVNQVLMLMRQACM